MKQYLDLVNHVIDNGRMVKTRNGIRWTVYGYQMRFDLTQGFPLVTTKRVPFRLVAGELCWFLNGQTDTKQLHEWNNHIWDANASEDGELGPIYGYQWRNFNSQGLDQIQRSIDLLHTDPSSTRNVVTAWNPLQMDDMKLPPCHAMFQIHTCGKNGIAIQMSQRSADTMVGIPFNIASYALLTHLLAHVVNKRPVELIMDLGNVHIYNQHLDDAIMQSERETLPLPRLHIDGDITHDLRNLHPDQFSLVGYESHPAIKYEMIV